MRECLIMKLFKIIGSCDSFSTSSTFQLFLNFKVKSFHFYFHKKTIDYSFRSLLQSDVNEGHLDYNIVVVVLDLNRTADWIYCSLLVKTKLFYEVSNNVLKTYFMLRGIMMNNPPIDLYGKLLTWSHLKINKIRHFLTKKKLG